MTHQEVALKESMAIVPSPGASGHKFRPATEHVSSPGQSFGPREHSERLTKSVQTPSCDVQGLFWRAGGKMPTPLMSL